MNPAELEYLFVYGTLRKALNHSLLAVLKKHAFFVSNGVCQGKLLNLGKYPGVVPSEDSGDVVYGEVYGLKDSKIILEILDHYEGCSPEFPTPAEFIRQSASILLTTGLHLQAWMYFYNFSPEQYEIITGGDYIKYLEKHRPHLLREYMTTILIEDEFDYLGDL